MNDPQRLLIGDGTALERELLRSVLDEPVPSALHARMLAALPLAAAPSSAGFEPTTMLGNAGNGSIGGGSVGGGAVGKMSAVAGTKIVSGAALKVLLVSLGMGSALTAGVVMTRSPSSPMSSVNVQHTTPTGVAPPADQPAVMKPPAAREATGEVGKAVKATSDEHAAAMSIEARAIVGSAPESKTDKTAPIVAAEEPAQVGHSPAARVHRGSKVAVPTLPAESSVAVAPEANVNRPATVNPTLSAELKLLDAARSAIQRGDSERSLQVLDTYARQFPHGELTHEANVLRGLAQRTRQ